MSPQGFLHHNTQRQDLKPPPPPSTPVRRVVVLIFATTQRHKFIGIQAQEIMLLHLVGRRNQVMISSRLVNLLSHLECQDFLGRVVSVC